MPGNNSVHYQQKHIERFHVLNPSSLQHQETIILLRKDVILLLSDMSVPFQSAGYILMRPYFSNYKRVLHNSESATIFSAKVNQQYFTLVRPTYTRCIIR